MNPINLSFPGSRTTPTERPGFTSIQTRKLNIGCGFNSIPGFLNLDKSPACHPDLVFDAESQPWPWETNSILEVLFFHSLEHMGADTNVFLGMIRELYRVCAPDARVRILAPHPRHDDFINDPTHVRVITPALLTLFDRQRNLQWIEGHFANTPLAIYLDVDFVLESSEVTLVSRYHEIVASGELSEETIRVLLLERNNIAAEYKIVLRVRK
jgi:hypothetical protein